MLMIVFLETAIVHICLLVQKLWGSCIELMKLQLFIKKVVHFFLLNMKYFKRRSEILPKRLSHKSCVVVQHVQTNEAERHFVSNCIVDTRGSLIQ